jgi:hypothetical protein
LKSRTRLSPAGRGLLVRAVLSMARGAASV